MVAKPAGAPGANVTYNSSTGSSPAKPSPFGFVPSPAPTGDSSKPAWEDRSTYQAQGNGSKPAWEEVKPRNPYVPNNGNPGGANNMGPFRPPGEYDRRPRPRVNMPGQPGYNPRMPARGIEQPGLEMWDQDPTGRMTLRPQRQGLPSDQQMSPDQLTGMNDWMQNYLSQLDPQAVMNNPQGARQNAMGAYQQQFGDQQRFPSGEPPRPMIGWNGPGGHPQGRYANNPYRPGNAGYYGGQSAGAGRYRPPMMDGYGGWQDFGGYNYNLPNAFGSYPGYGQGNPYSQFYGSGYEGFFGNSQGNPYGDFMSFYQNQNPYDVPYGG